MAQPAPNPDTKAGTHPLGPAPAPTLWLSPRGQLRLAPWDQAAPLPQDLREPLESAFAQGSGHGLLRLGAGTAGRALPPVLAFWRDLGARFVTALCARAEGADPAAPIPPPDGAWLEEAAASAPPMPGAEYLTPEVLESLWNELARAFTAEAGASGKPLQAFLQAFDPVWNLVGRVHFNLAENPKDPETPFAFLATYTGGLTAQGQPRHLPLGQALREYQADREKLLSLLVPVQRAAQGLPWLKAMVERNEIFHPLRWAPREAFRMLQDLPALEAAGVVVRMPAGWKAGRPSRPQVSATVGAGRPSGIGAKALLDFQAALTLDGEPLTPEETKALLAASRGLVLVRGHWVEVDPDRLRGVLDRYQEAERLSRRDGLTFFEAMRLLAGAEVGTPRGPETGTDGVAWGRVTAGPWLAKTLAGLRSPEGLAAVDPGPDLKGRLRPYQAAGVRWLHLLASLGLGACLADDMGLGKTIQVLALLLVRRDATRPSLLVAPASLLANWASELERFAPSLSCLVLHPSALPKDALKGGPPDLAGRDLVITSYGFLVRNAWLERIRWRHLILDEAQAIKNPAARQTRQVKRIPADARIALTGTPVENRLGDLWSIFDFLNPGLLGSAKAFTDFTRRLAETHGGHFGPLRDLVRPYLLRRVKSDRTVIRDLPDKTELRAFCPLSKVQAALYQEAVVELATRLEAADGIQRRGLVLSYLLRLKQICNHPAQWLGDGDWREEASGKLGRLRDLCDTIASRQEKVLVFTQFREATAPLATFLGGIFGREGLVLHGQTPVGRRRDLVRRFQEDEEVPFFVLSLKAGGSGLNLTAASHVIHFDRWWNPSVENQATDRAYRIGQRRNVMVHKFVCRGTVEERIDTLIQSKAQLTRELLEGGPELDLAGLADEELMRLVSLDLASALED